jgi:hypothetical protein
MYPPVTPTSSDKAAPRPPGTSPRAIPANMMMVAMAMAQRDTHQRRDCHFEYPMSHLERNQYMVSVAMFIITDTGNPAFGRTVPMDIEMVLCLVPVFWH